MCQTCKPVDSNSQLGVQFPLEAKLFFKQQLDDNFVQKCQIFVIYGNLKRVLNIKANSKKLKCIELTSLFSAHLIPLVGLLLRLQNPIS